MKEKFYITTSIIYANAKPHIGFALELLQADAIARWQRLLGKEVYFLTGTDEHGVKIYNTAQAAGEDPQAFVDKNAEALQHVLTALNISNTDFIRTTDEKRHVPTAKKVWEQLAAKGDIKPGHYQGYYSITEEAYITKTEFEAGGYDPSKVTELSEDNYLFDLPKYGSEIGTALESGSMEILPHHRAQEMINFAKPGLQEVSFSRPKDKLPWGISVPGDDSQVMYVWCDALTNYISALGYGNGDKDMAFWPADVQVIGKDILRFHALIWPGMLLGLGLPLPKRLLVHGHILSDGQKMSKSLGNVIDPLELIDRFGVDPVRYYLLGAIPTQDDGDFSQERFEELYNSDLANKLGNLLSRVHKLAGDYGIKHTTENPHGSAWSEYTKHMEGYNLSGAVGSVIDYTRWLNDFISRDGEEPWKIAKIDLERAQVTLYQLVESLRQISVMLSPFLPATSDKIRDQLGLAAISLDNFDLDKEMQWGGIPDGHKLGESAILFPKDKPA